MRKFYSLLLAGAFLGCDGEVPFSQRPPTAKILGPDLAAFNTDVFFSAQFTSSVGIESLDWEIETASAETNAIIVEELGPLVRVHTTGPGDVTMKVTVTDNNGIATARSRVSLLERALDRTMNVFGTEPDSRLGDRVFAAGDLNDDGHPDAIASAPAGKVGLKTCGFVDVFFGDNNGLETSPALHIFEPEPENTSEFGAAVATGDFDGDGLLDIAIGSPGYNTRTDSDVGRLYLYYGKGDGDFDLTAPLIMEAPATDFSADSEDDRFGAAIAVADWNNDGLDELVVSAPNRDRFETELSEGGEIYLFFGNTSRLYGNPDVVLLRTNPSKGLGAPERLGTKLVVLPSICGDENPDLATSIPGYDLSTGVQDVGAVLIYCSGNGLFFTTTGELLLIAPGGQTGDEFGASIVGMEDFDLDQRGELAIGAPGRGLNGSVFIIGAPGQEETELVGTTPGGRFGESIASMDLDASGNNDLIVATPDVGPGALVIFPCSPAGIQTPFTLQSPSAELEEFGRSIISAGDVDDDGLDDLLAGTPGAATGGIRLFF